MKYYFRLQFLRFNRLVRESGLHPILAYLFFGVVFIVSSHITIHNLNGGSWIYLVLSLYLFSRVQSSKLVQLIFEIRELRKIRILEAVFFSVPFSIMLCINQHYLAGFLLMLSLSVTSLISIKANRSVVVPTPFYQRPFEFPVGFRKYWLLLLIMYSLCIIAIVVGNFNLAIFSIVLIYLTIISFYSKPEAEFFVWVYDMSATRFLYKKIATCIVYGAFLTAPLLIALFVVFPENWLVTILLFLAGSLLPVVAVLNKYSNFPAESEVINSILIGSCLLFPPLLLIMVPYLANKAIDNLKSYL